MKSEKNSTNVPLLASDFYIGETDQSDLPDVMCSCFSDTDGTLYFDFRDLGSANWRTHPSDGFSIKANVHKFHIGNKGPREFRARFINSASTQSEFELFTYFGEYRQPNLPLNATLVSDTDSTVVRTVDSKADIALGRFTGFSTVNKFGRAPSGAQTSSTDIWDRADATPTQQVWTAPTQARVHAIASTSTDDDGNPAGTGARTIRIWGLTAWDTAEVSEDVTLNGTDSVNTVNSYVIIHQMRVLTCGASGPNVGTITATAATDGTVTAVIRPAIGSTAMAIYGWPSTQTLLLTDWWSNIMDSPGSPSDALISLFYNPDPGNSPALYIRRDTRGLQSDGTSSTVWSYQSYLALPGPAILKISAIASSADLDMAAGFDGILVDAT